MANELLNIAAVAQFYNRSQATIMRWVKVGLIPSPAVKDKRGQYLWKRPELVQASKQVAFYIPNGKEPTDKELTEIKNRIDFFTPKMTKQVATDMHHNTMTVQVSRGQQ
jgi:hypothetical protein